MLILNMRVMRPLHFRDEGETEKPALILQSFSKSNGYLNQNEIYIICLLPVTKFD